MSLAAPITLAQPAPALCLTAPRRRAEPVSHALRARGQAEGERRPEYLALAREIVRALTHAQHDGADCASCTATLTHLAQLLGVRTADVRVALLVAVAEARE